MGMAIAYVVDGATIQCSFGIGESKLNKTIDNKVKIHDQTILTVADNQPFTNIKPFSACTCKKNPAVMAGEEASLTCNPNICMKWTKGKTDITVNGECVLVSESTIFCIYGGKIEITDDGQRKGSAS